MSDALTGDLGVVEAKADIGKNAVADFCQRVFVKRSEEWPISENILADEFLAFARLEMFIPTLEEVSQVCRDRLGISVNHAPLPDGLHGHNYSYGNKREILISTNQDYYGATLHTLLHELREILENEFAVLGHPMADADSGDMEERAEAFATAVQIGAASTAVPVLLENAAGIERKWLRIGAYVLIVAGALAYALGCISIRQIEDSFAPLRSSRRRSETQSKNQNKPLYS